MLVVDASVAIKWFLLEPGATRRAACWIRGSG